MALQHRRHRAFVGVSAGYTPKPVRTSPSPQHSVDDVWSPAAAVPSLAPAFAQSPSLGIGPAASAGNRAPHLQLRRTASASEHAWGTMGGARAGARGAAAPTTPDNRVRPRFDPSPVLALSDADGVPRQHTPLMSPGMTPLAQRLQQLDAHAATVAGAPDDPVVEQLQLLIARKRQLMARLGR